MKSLWFILFSLLFVGTVSAQDGSKLLRALHSGNYQKVTRHFAPKVEICFGDDVFFLPKSKAATKFESIMNELHPTSVTALHKGSSDNKSAKYIIGEVKSQKGTYRLFIFAKRRGDRTVIKEIRLEPF